jgi:intraflagellar transport protein 88
MKEHSQAIMLLKEFEKKEKDLKARAATNLSFLYFLEGDLNNAGTYAELAVRTNRYNAHALVNQGNCLYTQVYSVHGLLSTLA